MAYGSLVGYGGGVALAALAGGHLWLVGLCASVVLAAALLIRARFRRGRGPMSR
ncbi:hypothetical protein MF672_041470 [Actinomadura sp. ATCC 31491]|uniref:MFS transporter n=1 Tax=Actinomadura luzonensis TaxID=2805427 RepID=A0ABT0G6I7_9ACTN|nr:hypothetical protein [Actinomadura luzonensis]MCK2220226.1 hypothetical protein [Actinomadura luzonensis]